MIPSVFCFLFPFLFCLFYLFRLSFFLCEPPRGSAMDLWWDLESEKERERGLAYPLHVMHANRVIRRVPLPPLPFHVSPFSHSCFPRNKQTPSFSFPFSFPFSFSFSFFFSFSLFLLFSFSSSLSPSRIWMMSLSGGSVQGRNPGIPDREISARAFQLLESSSQPAFTRRAPLPSHDSQIAKAKSAETHLMFSSSILVPLFLPPVLRSAVCRAVSRYLVCADTRIRGYADGDGAIFLGSWQLWRLRVYLFTCDGALGLRSLASKQQHSGHSGALLLRSCETGHHPAWANIRHSRGH